MQQLLKEKDANAALSGSKNEQPIHTFRSDFVPADEVKPHLTEAVLKCSVNQLLNQQEDEDNAHSQLTELVYY